MEPQKDKSVKKVTSKKTNEVFLMWICVAAIAIITFFVFSPSLDDGFTNWDDPYYVQQCPLVVDNSMPVVKIFETNVLNQYNPLTTLSLALNYQNGKLDPYGYHLENVILHVLNTILVFFFIFLLTRRNLLMAAIVSLFFGIHPMHVESVTWVSERKDVLYVFFFLTGLITYVRYSETKKISWYFFTLLLFIVCCLSKEMAVVFPVILILIDYLKGMKWKWRLVIEKIPFFLLSMVFGIIAVKGLQSIQKVVTLDLETYSIFQRLQFGSYGFLMYILKLFVPYKLSAFYPYPITTGNSNLPIIFYLSPLVLFGVVAALIYFFIKKEKEIVFGLLFYFTSVVLVLQFVSVRRAIMSERYSYLAYIGLLFVVAYIINKVRQSKRNILVSIKYPVMIIIIIGAVTFSFQTYSRTQVWENSGVLWTNVIDNYPSTAVAYKLRGDYYYFETHEIEKAISDYNTTIALDSKFASAYTNRAILYFNMGKADLAMADFTKAITLLNESGYNNYGDDYYNRGILYATYYYKNNLAIADFTKAIAFDSTSAKTYFNRGLIYSETGKYDSAIADYTKSVSLDSTQTDAYTNLGLLYSKTGKTNLAITDYTKAITLDPTTVNAYNDRAILYLNTGKSDLALSDYNKAIALNPSTALFYFNRGLCYNTVNQFEEAVKDFSKAIELNPSVAVFWLNRSLAENKIGQIENAKADALKAQQLHSPM